MKSPQKDSLRQCFIQSIIEDTPILKLVKYLSFIDINPSMAKQFKDQMSQIALENKLVMLYRQLCQKLGNKEYANAQRFKDLRGQMVNQTNYLHESAKNYKAQNKSDKLAKTLLELGNKYFKYGDFRESTNYLTTLSNMLQSSHQVRYEQYAKTLALSLYYLSQFYNLSRFNSKAIDKNILKKLPDLCIIRDINNIDLECQRKNMEKPFKNVIQIKLTDIQMSKNQVMSYNDIGFLYSLLAIAYQKKSDITFIKWSSKLQNKFMNNRYKQVLDTITRQQKKRCFLPIFKKVYYLCKTQINKRILIQIISSYDRCPFKIVQNMTGISQIQIKNFVTSNQQIPLLIDPTTQSVIYNRNVLPLYYQVKMLHDRLKRNLDDQVNSQRMDGQGIGIRGFGFDDRLRIGGPKAMGISGMGGMGGMGGGQGKQEFQPTGSGMGMKKK